MPRIEKGTAARGDELVVGDFFAACTNTAAIDAAGTKPIDEALKRIASIQTVAAIQREIASLAARGISVPFQLSGRPHPDDPNKIIPTIAPSALALKTNRRCRFAEQKSRAEGQSKTLKKNTLHRLSASSQ
jgi:predicted metalloendopeptidase